MKQTRWIAAAVLALSLQAWQVQPDAAKLQGRPQADVPTFEVDPGWPKPLPNNWVLGQAPSVFVDARDHVWVVTRPRTLIEGEIAASLSPPTAECCVPAPPVIEFDAEGRVVQSWGGPGEGYEWPDNEHGIFVDHKRNVWIGGNGRGDRHILKFSSDGKFLLQIGRKLAPPATKTASSNDIENLNSPAGVVVEPKANEVYVADGYGNRRIIVFDADSGKYKRHWGAYGHRPDDDASRDRTYEGPPPQQFNLVHGIRLSNDGHVYVADRYNSRIQVFRLDGTFVKEGFIARHTLDSRGTASDVAFSADPAQRFLYVVDAANYKVRILDRQTLEPLSWFGRLGYYPGQWKWVHGIATDSKGNIFTSESQGNRVQKFTLRTARGGR
jgi:hypothetical protein